jgi:predicted nucleotidyltransferase
MSNKKTEKFINNKADKLVQEAMVKANALKSDYVYYGMKENLRAVLNKAGMAVNIHFYGSRLIGLASAESDLDIFVEFGEFLDSL